MFPDWLQTPAPVLAWQEVREIRLLGEDEYRMPETQKGKISEAKRAQLAKKRRKQTRERQKRWREKHGLSRWSADIRAKNREATCG